MASIVETARKVGKFNSLLRAAKDSGYVYTLSFSGPFTVFAPRDDAFANLPEGALERLAQNPEDLKNIIALHVVPGKFSDEDMLLFDNLPTLQGQNLKITSGRDGIRVNGAGILATNIETDNGIIHIVDRVISLN